MPFYEELQGYGVNYKHACFQIICCIQIKFNNQTDTSLQVQLFLQPMESHPTEQSVHQTLPPYNYLYYYTQNKINAFKKSTNMTISRVSLFSPQKSNRFPYNQNESALTDKIESLGLKKLEATGTKTRKNNPEVRNIKSALFDSRQTRLGLYTSRSRQSLLSQQEVPHSEEMHKFPRIQNSPGQQSRTGEYEQYIKFIVDSYERQLSECRKQIQHLRNAQDECVVLREVCLRHYEQCEKSPFKKK